MLSDTHGQYAYHLQHPVFITIYGTLTSFVFKVFSLLFSSQFSKSNIIYR